jgi:hypothetical protein
MNARYLFVPLGTLIAFVAIIWISLERFAFPAVAQPISSEPAGEIFGDRVVGQRFESPYPGLNRIDVLLATYDRVNSQPVIFRLHAVGAAEEPVHQETFSASDVQNNAFRTFSFPAQKDSQGKAYLFTLESPTSTEWDAITAWKNAADSFSEGEIIVENDPGRGDLAFVAHYDPSPFAVGGYFLERLAKDKPGLWGVPAFYLLLMGAYVALFITFIMSLLLLPPNPKKQAS